MASLRYEFLQLRDRREIAGGGTLAVTTTATAGGARPVVPTPTAGERIMAVFWADAMTYVDIGAAPNPGVATAAMLLEPGVRAEIEVAPGDLISAVLATDVQATASQGYTTGKVSITRPANVTAYAAGDVVGGAITFAGIGPAQGGQVMIRSASLELDIAAIPAGMTSFSLHLYNVTPPSALADNAVFDLPAGDRASHIGIISLGTPVDLGSTLKVRTDNINQQITVPAGGTIFGYLVTTGGFTPAANSEVYVISLHGQAI